MRKIFIGIAAIFAIVVIGAGVYLWTPGYPAFDRAAALETAKAYDVRIIRDKFGVPHIYGRRDADVGFGLAYAHAEDDWATLEEVLFFTRGEFARRNGKDGAVTDYLMAALGVADAITKKYDSDLSVETRALLEGYAAGLNLWCAEEKPRCAPGAAPVTPQDVVAGFVARTPFFYGLDETLTTLFDGDLETEAAAETARETFLHLDKKAELGSNAIAVAPSRSSDGHTRLMVNSHQPFTGPVAWYEARVKSEEGWDMIGGVFPGAPLILHGAGPNLGWAFTVNKPDLVDIYALDVDHPKNPQKYKFDGGWRDFEASKAEFRVKLFGPFSLPVTRIVRRSVHGPVFDTPNGFFAVAFAGDGDIRSAEQWRLMNRAQDFTAWQAALAMQAIPSFNVIYADRTGNIAYFYNAAIPVRAQNQDWSKVAPGGRADLVWRGVEPFGTAPSVVNPSSGYVVNSNNAPFEASAPADSPASKDFPPHLGIDRRTTNRGLRLQELYGADASIAADEFVAYKMDNLYAANSRLRLLISEIVADPVISADARFADAVALLKQWRGSTAKSNRAAALAILTGQGALGFLLNRDDPEFSSNDAALANAIEKLEQGFGRIDPEWGEVSRLKRGDIDLPLAGGPDTLRAIYAIDDPGEGAMAAIAGDTYILYADWPTDGGAPVIQTIHQFGAATLDATSPHYADQTGLFAAEKFKTPPMTLEAALAEATADYRPGQN